MEAELRRDVRGHVQTQTSFQDSDSSFEYESDRVSLHSVLHRLSSLFHSYLGGTSQVRRLLFFFFIHFVLLAV